MRKFIIEIIKLTWKQDGLVNAVARHGIITLFNIIYDKFNKICDEREKPSDQRYWKIATKILINDWVWME